MQQNLPPRRPRVIDPSAVREVWREGEDVVLHAKLARLPNYCIVTGNDVGGFRTTEELVFLSWTGHLFGTIGLSDLFLKRYPVQLPVSRAALRSKQKFRRPGQVLMALGGVGVFVSAILVQMALQKSPKLAGLPGAFPWLVLLAGATALIVGAFMSRSGMLPLRIVSVDGPYIKIRGAHPNFLKTLQPVRPQ